MPEGTRGKDRRPVWAEYAILLRPDLQPAGSCLRRLFRALQEDSGGYAFCAVPASFCKNKNDTKYGALRRTPASRASESKTCFKEEPVSSAGEQTFVPDKNGVKTPFIEEPVSRNGKCAFVPDKNGVKTPFIEEKEEGAASETVAVPDGCALYRMRALEEIGWFDERHFDGLEAFDLSLRALLHGYRTLRVPLPRVLRLRRAPRRRRHTACCSR